MPHAMGYNTEESDRYTSMEPPDDATQDDLEARLDERFWRNMQTIKRNEEVLADMDNDNSGGSDCVTTIVLLLASGAIIAAPFAAWLAGLL